MGLIKFLWILSGDDYRIIRKCKKRTKYTFAAIGGVVAVITLVCFVGSYLIFINAFGSVLIGLPIGLFFAWMISNIYLLILYTLSKDVLPHKPSTGGKLLSKGIRIGFVIFIAIVVSKPIEVHLYTNNLTADIQTYKVRKIDAYTRLTEAYINAEIQELQSVLGRTLTSPAATLKHAAYYEQMIVEKLQKKEHLISEMERKVLRSNFYIQRILLLTTKYPSSWWITAFCIIVFLLPYYFKMLISEQNEFNRHKKEVQVNLVKAHYESFKEEYVAVLKPIGSSIQPGSYFTYSERFEDPPFNTIKKTDIKSKSVKDLTDLIYHG